MYPARLPDGRIKPPFGPPDCPWKSVSPGSSISENAVEFGKLNGDQVYIGRVYDNDCWLIGTAVPSKGVCHYLSRNAELKSTDSYDVLTCDCGNPLEFESPDFESNLLFVAGGNEDHCLYAARVVDGENTYIGWVDKKIRVANLPRDPSVGPNQVKENFGVLNHKLLDRLCVCPMPPPYSY
ncbi:uncharacterized protein [Parasteatoda tepidariorum]|nr:uncharacterized protein LOC107454242 [Parasteatoda tepidariorum]